MSTTTHSPSGLSQRPAAIRLTPVDWLQKNLFSSWFNGLLTVLVVATLGTTVLNFIKWAFTAAKWQVIPANLSLFFMGRFPANQYWRIWLILGLISLLAGLSWGVLGRKAAQLFSRPVLVALGIIALLTVLLPTPLPYRLTLLVVEAVVVVSAWVGRNLGQRVPALGQWLSLAWALSFFVALWLMSGGLGLPVVSTTTWGGLLLTLFMSLVSIALSFPFGVLLALGRQSSLPVVRWLSTLYIELVRGVPLISILFIGLIMIPLFLPTNIRPDLVLRATLGLTLFTAAYLAETIRGGLQAIPKGQYEAASSLGLNTPLALALIVLPQALKISIPAIVGLFISLLQDTTLVAIVGLFDLLGISRSILANPSYIGRYAEVYLFIGLIYWFFCYAMSQGSRKIEAQLNTTH
ncbi:MAG TPA: amino acid ABC transporter permease [Leptolyngbyaceae cyanobacterium]